MNRKFEEMIIRFCSCTIKGLKVGSLFSLPMQACENIHSLLSFYQQYFTKRELSICILAKRKSSYLIYIYSEKALSDFWQKEEVNHFLHAYGYSSNVSSNIERLKKRLQSNEFPHEIGVFLGYAIDDVKSFILYEGQHYQVIGPWKVYHDVHEKCRLFESFQHCTNTCLNQFYAGQQLFQLI